MAQSSAARMRRHRERKGRGVILMPQFQINPHGIKLLAEKGWLTADAHIDSKLVSDALLRFINESLKQPQKPEPRIRKALHAVTARLL